jgi:hypothetical protein
MGALTERFRNLSDYLYSKSPLIPFLLLGMAVVLDAVFVFVVVEAIGRNLQGRATGGFFSEPVPAVLLILAAVAVIASAVTALIDLMGHRLTSTRGKWAFRLAIVNCLLLPVTALAVTAIAALGGFELEEGWGQPIMPVWFVVGFIATVLGATAPEPRRRGVLVLPLMIGAFAFVFVVGEITVPH